MKLISVVSARKTDQPGVLAMVVHADPENGIEGEADYPFCYVPGDIHGISPAVARWLETHLDFPISEAAI